MEHLKCSVTNCFYNESEHCSAEHINVYNTGDGFANSSDGTGCKTFRPKRDSASNISADSYHGLH